VSQAFQRSPKRVVDAIDPESANVDSFDCM
jgi:hypothetical protein